MTHTCLNARLASVYCPRPRVVHKNICTTRNRHGRWLKISFTRVPAKRTRSQTASEHFPENDSHEFQVDRRLWIIASVRIFFSLQISLDNVLAIILSASPTYSRFILSKCRKFFDRNFKYARLYVERKSPETIEIRVLTIGRYTGKPIPTVRMLASPAFVAHRSVFALHDIVKYRRLRWSCAEGTGRREDGTNSSRWTALKKPLGRAIENVCTRSAINQPLLTGHDKSPRPFVSPFRRAYRIRGHRSWRSRGRPYETPLSPRVRTRRTNRLTSVTGHGWQHSLVPIEKPKYFPLLSRPVHG